MGKKNLTELIDDLSTDDLGEVLELIQRKAQGKNKRRKQNRKKIILPEDDGPRPKRTQKRRPRSRRNRDFDIQEHRKNVSQGRGNQGRQSRPMSLQTGPRDNEFLQMKERFAAKSDIKIDKLLSGNNIRSDRRDEIQYLRVQCTRCHNWFDVLPREVYQDDSGIQYVCNNCGQKRE